MGNQERRIIGMFYGEEVSTDSPKELLVKVIDSLIASQKFQKECFDDLVSVRRMVDR
jgi:hypothetical protein